MSILNAKIMRNLIPVSKVLLIPTAILKFKSIADTVSDITD